MQVMAPKRPSLLIRPLHEHGDQRSFEAIRGHQRGHHLYEHGDRWWLVWILCLPPEPEDLSMHERGHAEHRAVHSGDGAAQEAEQALEGLGVVRALAHDERLA